MTDSVLARVAALKTTPTPALKAMWRDLFETEPPPYNRRFLESRLAYRIQELAYGGLKPETIKRLQEIAEDLDGGDPVHRRRPVKDRPIAGTRLIREYQGVEHCVTVRDDDFEYQGRPYKSLSAVAAHSTPSVPPSPSQLTLYRLHARRRSSWTRRDRRCRPPVARLGTRGSTALRT
jgi:hypothetical protein